MIKLIQLTFNHLPSHTTLVKSGFSSPDAIEPADGFFRSPVIFLHFWCISRSVKHDHAL